MSRTSALSGLSDGPGMHHIMEDAGQKLRRVRERLNLRVRDVEQASLRIAEKYRNDEFAVLINRISPKSKIAALSRPCSSCIRSAQSTVWTFKKY